MATGLGGAGLYFIFALVVMSALHIYCLERSIILLPGPFSSHVSYFKVVGDELSTRYGYVIHMLLPPTYPYISQARTWNMTIITYKVKPQDRYPRKSERAVKRALADGPLSVFRSTSHFMQFCTNPLADTDLHEKLKDLNFALAILDAVPLNRCLVVLLYRLGTPFVSLTSQYEPWLFRNPSLPSFLPFPLGTTYTEKMTIWQRLWNLVKILDWNVLPRSTYVDDNHVKKYAPDMPYKSLNSLLAKSMLWLLNADTVLDYPRPTMPNVIEVGGLTTRPGKRLSNDMDRLLNHGALGTILVSFGSIVDTIPIEIAQKVADALLMFPYYVVVWKYQNSTNAPSGLGGNIVIREWIPQNDLLADNRTLLFITHCGNNGQFEAVHQGVPMVGIPLFADQFANAVRMQYHGYGLIINTADFTSNQLEATIREVLHNPTYKANIQRASNIFRSRVHPRKRAAFWVNHVLQFGAGHLHSHALDMPWYEYLMLDILAFVFLILAVFCKLFSWVCSYVIRCLRTYVKVKTE